MQCEDTAFLRPVKIKKPQCMKQIFYQLFIAERGAVNICLRAIFGKVAFINIHHRRKQERIGIASVYNIKILIA